MSTTDASRSPSEHTITSPNSHTEEPKLEEKSEGEPVPQRDVAPQSDIVTDDGIIVTWDENEPGNPRNWSNIYRFWITFLLGLMAFTCSVGSSITAPATEIIASEYGVSDLVAVLQISLYILGFALGPIIWGPVSEVWGRRWSMIPPLFVLAIFSIATAVSKNIASIFVTRFLGGVVGASAVSNVNAALGDMWSPDVRSNAVSFYSLMVVGGPSFGPIIGSAVIVNPQLNWRWTEWIQAIWSFVVFLLSLFFLPEVYAPVLLSRKAKKLRKEKNDERYYHPHERATLDAKSIVTKHFSRPIVMLTTEPVVTAIAFYASFVYGMLYMTLEVFPIVFEEIRGFGPVVGSLPFLALFIGVFLACFANAANQPRYKRLFHAAGDKPVPDARLLPIVGGGVFFATGMYWFGWTAHPQYNVWNPIIAASFIGFGFNVIFIQCMNVLVDTYTIYAASATSANTILRSFLAAGFPIAAKPMFHALGTGVAMSILGAVATVMIFVPFILMRYGPALRRRSKMAAERVNM